MKVRLNSVLAAVLAAYVAGTGEVRAVEASLPLSSSSPPQSSQQAADPELEQARTLMAQGNAAAAYALLAPREFDRAGDVEFDTLLGVAALDSGNPDKATLAFERVLTVDPNAAGARLDMARAYFALNDLARARQEFDAVAKDNPPPAARAVIDRYLAAITERERARTTVTTAYVEGFVGYDNNITSVVGDFSNAVLASYNLPGFQPTGNAVLRASPIAGGAAGFDITHKIDDAWSVAGAADLIYRNVTEANDYSSEQFDLRGSASRTIGADSWRGSFTLQDYAQRTDVPTNDRNALGLNLEWRHAFGERDQFGLFGVATRERYPDIAVDNIDSLLFGVGWLHLFGGVHNPLLYVTAMAGQDNAKTPLDNGSDNSRRNAGAHLYGQWSATDRLDLFANLGMLERSDRSAYARATAVAYGNDHIDDSTVGMNWRPAPRWTVRPQVTYTANRSNVALSAFCRTEATVTVRYQLQ